MENDKDLPFLTCTYALFLPFSTEVEGVGDRSWQGQKWLCSFPRIVEIRQSPKTEPVISREEEHSGFSIPFRSEHIIMIGR